jgi:hypothetical protein
MRWLVALLLLTSVAVAQSPPDSEPQSKDSPVSDQQGPTQPSPAVNLLTPEQITKAITDGIEAAAKQYETKHPAAQPDNSGWLFNLLLTVFTGGLVVVGGAQCFLIFWTLQATEVAAKAAQTAAEAIQITERPYIFVWRIVGTIPTLTFTTPNLFNPPEPERIIHNDAQFYYRISNRGKLAAVIETVSIACGYDKNGQYPPLRIIGDHQLMQTPLIPRVKTPKILFTPSLGASWIGPIPLQSCVII